jgi:hypothetical protein
MLRRDDFDPNTGLLLPSLADPDEGYSDEYIREFGEQVRLEYIEETAARQLARLKQEAEDRAAGKPPPPPKSLGEPHRVVGFPPPVWSSGLGAWTPMHIYSPRGIKRYREFLNTKTQLTEAERKWLKVFRANEQQVTVSLPLPRLT